MKVGSLFSGIGGVELGFERAGGFTTEWFVENEPHAQFILRKHWPNAKVYDDVTQVNFRTVPRVDILTGGFPCQDISNAGKRAGITGSRSSLWKHYLRAISEIRPKYALIENVSALIRRGLDVVLCDLASVGYDAEWHVVSASSVGALHRRERVFILAYPSDLREGYDAGGFRESDGETGRELSRSLSESSSEISTSFNVSDTCGEGLQRENCETGHVARQGWWESEPDVGRVADGISLKVDRIKRLGNAVVPQCAEIFAKAIKEDHGRG